MTPILVLTALPLGMMLQLQAGENHFYRGLGDEYWASFELDEDDQIAKTFADHSVAAFKCPSYSFDQLSWRVDEAAMQQFTQQMGRTLEQGSEIWRRGRYFAQDRILWLESKEAPAVRYAQNGMIGSRPTDMAAFTQLKGFCEHMAKSPANILIEIGE